MTSMSAPSSGSHNKAQPSSSSAPSSATAAGTSSSSSVQQQANWLWSKQPKASVELFALTYGALVGELLRDLEKPELITTELDRMGHSMGLRGMEELLSTQQLQSPDLNAIVVGSTSFPETAPVLQTALKMFFGITTDEVHATPNGYSLLFVDNPLALFVELPDDYAGSLEYSALLTGWCRGCLEVLQMDCACEMRQSVLAGDAVNEIAVTLNQVLRDGAGEDYQEE